MTSHKEKKMVTLGERPKNDKNHGSTHFYLSFTFFSCLTKSTVLVHKFLLSMLVYIPKKYFYQCESYARDSEFDSWVGTFSLLSS